MRCTNCGHENTDRAKFCAKCSNPLSSTPSVDRVQLDGLLESGRFAALIKAIPDQVDSGLLELRAEAQRRFSETANQMVALYQERFGLREWSERRTRTALQDFREKTLAGSAVDDPGEAEAYAAMFIQDASSRIAQGDFDRARAILNALQVLPQQRDNYRQTIKTLLKSIPSSGDGLSGETSPPTPDSPTLTRRLPVSPDDTPGPVSPPTPDSPKLTWRLPVSPDDTPSPTPLGPSVTLDFSKPPVSPDDTSSPLFPDPTAEDEADPALAALDVLEVQIAQQASLPREELARPATERPGWTELVSALSQARSSVPANSPLLPRLSSASTRLDLLRDSTRALLSALDRPLVDWLMPGSTLEKTSAEIFVKLEQGFGPDIAPVPGLRRERDRHLDEVRVVKVQLDSLENLDGEALEIQLKELEQRQIPGTLPQMLTASRRLGEYQARLTASKNEEAARKARDEQVRSSYEKRRELDNLYEDATPTPDKLISLRDEARELADNKLLTSDDNPLDLGTFAYYDLLFASRYRTLTAPSEGINAAQTLLGKGDYLKAYRAFQEEVTKLQGGDDRQALEAARTKLTNARAELLKNLEETTRESLASAKKLLELFDYLAADQTLSTQRKYISDAGVALDPSLLKQLEQEEQATQALATRDRTARELITRAEQLTQPGSANLDFKAAQEALDKAAQTATWLQSAIERQTEQVRKRRAEAIAGQLRLAEGRIKGGTLATFAEAEALLSNAEKNANEDSERHQIGLLRDKIEERRQSISQLEHLRATALKHADDARTGTNLDLLPGWIIQIRHRIGPQEDPKIDEGSWAEIERFLTTAEARLAAREQFNGLVARANQAALLGKEQEFADLLSAITTLTSQHTFLKLDTAETLAKQARQGSRVDQARQYLAKMRLRLKENDSTLSADEINSAILNTGDYNSDEEVKQDHAFLVKMLPLYRDRDLLKNALNVSDFSEFDRIYTGLGSEIQTDPLISRLKQEAEIARARALFQQSHDTLQREAKACFRDGWDNPAKLIDFMSRLRIFADQLPAAQRQEEPALAPSIIGELESLSETLVAARADYDNHRYPASLRRVESALNVIPASATQGTLLDAYASTLAYLRTVLTSVREEINEYIRGGEGDTNRLAEAITAYSECVGDLRRAFNKAELVAVRNKFMLPVAPQRQAERDSYARILKRIADLIDEADALEDLIITGHSHGEPVPANQDGAARKALVEQQIKKILDESKEIRTAEGAAWLGIQGYARFQALNAHRNLAHDLAEAELWLKQARNVQQPVNSLRHLRANAENLNLNIAGSKIEKDLELAGCTVLIEKCKEFNTVIQRRVPKIQAEIKRRESQRTRTIGTSLSLIALIAMGLGAWSIPTVHDRAIVALVGTLTPAPPATNTPNPAGTSFVVVTATPVPTNTPIPTPTPIPPQAGVVTVPGFANVRMRPDANLARAGIVEAGDVILITGYTTAPDGTLWYRINVASRSLPTVWLLAEITDRGRLWQSVRIEGGAALNPALQLPYQP